MGQGGLIKLILFDLGYQTGRYLRNVFPSSFYCSILIRRIAFIASAEIPECNGNISPSNFDGQLPEY